LLESKIIQLLSCLQKSDDGIALVALGLGKTVVEGGNTVRFCPRFPKHLLSSFQQKNPYACTANFFALDLNGKLDHHPESTKDPLVKRYIC